MVNIGEMMNKAIMDGMLQAIIIFMPYEEHHKYGADIAKEILNELNYDKEKTALVQKCHFVTTFISFMTEKSFCMRTQMLF